MTDEQTDDNDLADPVDATKEVDGSAEQAKVVQPDPMPPAPVIEAEPRGNKPVARYFSFIFLLGVIGLVGVIFYWVMARFLIPLFLAALLVVIFRPLHRWMLEQTRGRQTLAALLTTLSILLAVLVPIGVLIVMAAAEGRDVLKQFSSTKILSDVQEARTKLNWTCPTRIKFETSTRDFWRCEGCRLRIETIWNRKVRSCSRSLKLPCLLYTSPSPRD